MNNLQEIAEDPDVLDYFKKECQDLNLPVALQLENLGLDKKSLKAHILRIKHARPIFSSDL